MKKGMIFLVLIVAILLCSITAFASGLLNFGGGQLSQGSWNLQSGDLAVGSDGVYSPAANNIISTATHPVSVESGDSYTCTFTFAINDLDSDVLVGIGDGGSQTLAGYNGGEFMIGNNGWGGSASESGEYTVQFTSIDDNSFSVHISGSGIDATQTVTGSLPTSAIMRITSASDNGPVISSAAFDAAAAPTPTPTPSPGPSDEPTVTPSPTAQGVDHSDMMNWYANNYVPPVLSNQSYIYNDDGKLVQVVTGKPTSGVVVAGESANLTAPAIANLTTPAGNATTSVIKNSTVPTVMPKTTVTVAPTKTQSPGFGIILVAISMMAALFYFNRKK